MLYDGNKFYYPLILIGSNVQIGPDRTDTIECLCASPSGRIAIVEQDPSRTGESDHDFLDRITKYSDMLRSWSWSDLDEIATNHYYRTEGQAFKVIDLMARAGYLEFADEGLLSVKLQRGLKTEQHLIIVSSQEIQTRRSTFACGEFADSHLYFSFVGDELPFLPK